jgi:sialic acid synthase
MAELRLAPSHLVGDGHPYFVIAEIGINHQGDPEIARELIRAAHEAGADAVKFQKRDYEHHLTAAGLDRPYPGSDSFGETYGDHKRALELSENAFYELKDYATELGILFTASGWDEPSVDFLAKLDVPFFKVSSADLTNFPLLEHTAAIGKPLILSSGMASIDTVEQAVELVCAINPRVVLMQCSSNYPSQPEEINLRVIQTFRERFPELVIGYSGHEKGIAVTVAAAAMGAAVLERHLTLDRTMKGGDHAASLEPQGLAKMIRDLRILEVALGDGVKRFLPTEKPIFEKLAKCICAVRRIPAGTVLSAEMLRAKSPAVGLSPMHFRRVMGRRTLVDLEPDEPLLENHVEWD